MIHVLVILLVLSVYIGGPFANDAFPGRVSAIAFPAHALIAWGPVLLFGVLCSWWYARAKRQLDQTGSAMLWERADRRAGLLRLLLTVHTSAMIVAGGWLDAARSVVGNPPVLDELLAITGPLLFFVWAWWAQAALDRRVREAGIVRALDEGRPVTALPSRGRLTWLQVRHHLLIVLVPLLLIRLWSESSSVWLRSDAGRSVLDALERRAGLDPGLAVELVVLPGVLVVLLLMPLMLRPLWQAGPVPVALAKEIRALAAHARVRLGGLMSWDTSSTMVNAMVVGPVWPFRQVMFSDAILERVPLERVLAVAAHEIAHIRYRHLVWLMLGGGAALVLVSGITTAVGTAIGALVGTALDQPLLGSGASVFVQFTGTVLSMAAMLVAVIYLSRRFEWQADAYAATEMSRVLRGYESYPCRFGVSRDGAIVMINALAQVAALNGIAPTRPAWRHGSIALRQRLLLKLAREGTGRPPIDAQVRSLKNWVLAAILFGVIVGVLGSP